MAPLSSNRKAPKRSAAPGAEGSLAVLRRRGGAPPRASERPGKRHPEQRATTEGGLAVRRGGRHALSRPAGIHDRMVSDERRSPCPRPRRPVGCPKLRMAARFPRAGEPRRAGRTARGDADRPRLGALADGAAPGRGHGPAAGGLPRRVPRRQHHARAPSVCGAGVPASGRAGPRDPRRQRGNLGRHDRGRPRAPRPGRAGSPAAGWSWLRWASTTCSGSGPGNAPSRISGRSRNGSARRAPP